MLFLIKKHTDTLIEQTKTKPQEALEFKMDKQMETFFSPLINLVEEGKRLIAVTSFKATNSVFHITHEKISFSYIIPGHWNSDDGEELNYKLNKLSEPRLENDIELHLE